MSQRASGKKRWKASWACWPLGSVKGRMPVIVCRPVHRIQHGEQGQEDLSAWGRELGEKLLDQRRPCRYTGCCIHTNLPLVCLSTHKSEGWYVSLYPTSKLTKEKVRKFTAHKPTISFSRIFSVSMYFVLLDRDYQETRIFQVGRNTTVVSRLHNNIHTQLCKHIVVPTWLDAKTEPEGSGYYSWDYDPKPFCVMAFVICVRGL